MKETIEQTSVSGILNITYDEHRDIFIKKGIGFIKSTHNLSDSEYRNIEVYRATDYQIVIVNNGILEIECNLQPFILKLGDILVFSPGTLICTKRKSTDYDATIISLNAPTVDSIKPFGFRLLRTVKPGIRDLYVCLISRLLTETKGNSQIILAILSFIDYLMEQPQDESNHWQKHDRKSEIFKSFLSLVNENGRLHHMSGYYAEKLCISLNYLNDIVKEKSGKTVYQWINEYLITEAKAQLLHSSSNVQQISDYLKFPNSAFFCRFFKTHTGVTPSHFRKSR